jgi:aryl-alcohol dehydrogenase-like predicted oxidoreductase
MDFREFGSTGLIVSTVGLGAGHIGSPEQDDGEVGRLLNAAADAGVTLFDTARGYGLSEERIGRHLAWRRNELVLSTKCGYGIDGTADWTYDCVAKGIDEALRRLATDRIDIMHLHSCPLHILERGEVIHALHDAINAGKVIVAAYSGEGDALDFAVNSGKFGSVQCSVNVCDQRCLDGQVKAALGNGLGVIAKRPNANAFWRFKDQPHGEYCEDYWIRARAMELDPGELGWTEFALRFSAHAPGVSSVIVGTAKLRHLEENIAAVRKGPLPSGLVTELREHFKSCDMGWVGQV